jgi:hypothetical protein
MKNGGQLTVRPERKQAYISTPDGKDDPCREVGNGAIESDMISRETLAI